MEGQLMKVPLAVRAIPSLAVRAWFTPPPLSDRRRAVWESSLEGTKSITLDVDGNSLKGFVHGQGPLVFLVHGWGGRAAQMGRLGKSVAALGFNVVAVDFPGHGEQKWDRSDIFQMSTALRALKEHFGHPDAVIAHSLGSMAAVYAFQEEMPGRLVLLAPMLDVSEALATFAERARLLPWASALLKRRIRRFCGDSWPIFAAGTDTDFGEAQVMVVHDPADLDTRFESSAVLAAVREDTQLVVTKSKGHNGILADDEVAGEIGRFLIGLDATRERSA
jgi:alpha-beta hydrolase superfamily lysophospholipase